MGQLARNIHAIEKATKKVAVKKSTPTKKSVKKKSNAQKKTALLPQPKPNPSSKHALKLDRTTYKFKENELGKGQFVLAVVQDYAKHHPRINEAQLREVFPDSLVSRYGVFANLKSAKEKSKTSGKKRYFVNDSQVFELGGEDGKKYAVTNQITSAIMVKFMEHIIAKGLWEN